MRLATTLDVLGNLWLWNDLVARGEGRRWYAALLDDLLALGIRTVYLVDPRELLLAKGLCDERGMTVVPVVDQLAAWQYAQAKPEEVGGKIARCWAQALGAVEAGLPMIWMSNDTGKDSEFHALLRRRIAEVRSTLEVSSDVPARFVAQFLTGMQEPAPAEIMAQYYPWGSDNATPAGTWAAAREMVKDFIRFAAFQRQYGVRIGLFLQMHWPLARLVEPPEGATRFTLDLADAVGLAGNVCVFTTLFWDGAAGKPGFGVYDGEKLQADPFAFEAARTAPAAELADYAASRKGEDA